LLPGDLPILARRETSWQQSSWQWCDAAVGLPLPLKMRAPQLTANVTRPTSVNYPY
jgi:hypothetical protein